MTSRSKHRLSVELMPFPDALLDAWKGKDYSLLGRSKASPFLKGILKTKAEERGGRRFFGEAFISSRLCRGEGYYSSFKWLTSPRWVSGRGLEPRFEVPFYQGLMRHFGQDRIGELQESTRELYRRCAKDLEEKKPVAPDLWLVVDGRHHFIECKLPKDDLAPHQIAGLALIAKYLKGDRPIQVSVINLMPSPEALVDSFASFYRQA